MIKQNNDTKTILMNAWDLKANHLGELIIGGCSAVHLSDYYGTPLHVVNHESLYRTAESFLDSVRSGYPGKTSVHFAFKCNPVPGIIKIIKTAGIKAEVMSEFELLLALKLGFTGREIVVNGPYKTDKLINLCIENDIRFINVDSLFELEQINRICIHHGKDTDVLLRINPDYIPAGMSKRSATADRNKSHFGLDMKGGEVRKAFELLKKMKRINFKGFHVHIGTGIQDTDAFKRAILKLRNSVQVAEEFGHTVEVLNVGGGLGVPFSREMTKLELLWYQTFDHISSNGLPKKDVSFKKFTDSVIAGVKSLFDHKRYPELIFEPGRCISSQNQLLLLNIHQIKERKGIRKWIIANAGIGTLTMPTYYEHHEIIVCNDIYRNTSGKATLTGPGCFADDVIYRNIPMPEINPGELIAIMDSGAYFTSWESNFGFPKPAIVSVFQGDHSLLRARETFDDMVSLDIF